MSCFVLFSDAGYCLGSRQRAGQPGQKLRKAFAFRPETVGGQAELRRAVEAQARAKLQAGGDSGRSQHGALARIPI